MIPLITLYIAYQVAMRLLAMLSQAGYVEVFQGLEVYASVVVYGAGVDYNLFLISRYQEEAEGEPRIGEALGLALGRIGGAVTASAATVTCGIGTLLFAQFGKFREAGFGISFSLLVMLFATMTLTPALLRLAGRWAFWPRRLGVAREQQPHLEQGWARRLAGSSNLFDDLWHAMGRAIERRPGTVWLLTVLVMSPFAGYAVTNYDHVNYDQIQDLPETRRACGGQRSSPSISPSDTPGRSPW